MDSHRVTGVLQRANRLPDLRQRPNIHVRCGLVRSFDWTKPVFVNIPGTHHLDNGQTPMLVCTDRASGPQRPFLMRPFSTTTRNTLCATSGLNAPGASQCEASRPQTPAQRRQPKKIFRSARTFGFSPVPTIPPAEANQPKHVHSK